MLEEKKYYDLNLSRLLRCEPRRGGGYQAVQELVETLGDMDYGFGKYGLCPPWDV